MTTTTTTDTRDIISTDADEALLAAWYGEYAEPIAYWPTSAPAEFESALREWIREDTQIWGRTDEETGGDDSRVDRYMAAITIELPRIDDEQIDALRREAGQAGDAEIVAACDEALEDGQGSPGYAACRDAILSARGA